MPPRTARAAAPARRRPGPKPSLTVDQIVDAALNLIREEGLAAVSLRRLAEDLGVTPMAIYRYLKDKDELLGLLVERVVPSPEAPDEAAPWAQQMRAAMRHLHQALLEYPGLAELVAGHSIANPALDHFREKLFGMLIKAGLSPYEAVDGVTILANHTLGAVMLESGRREHAGAADTRRLEALPRKEFPTMSTLADAYSGRATNRSFEFGLDIIIEGLQSRASRPPAH